MKNTFFLLLLSLCLNRISLPAQEGGIRLLESGLYEKTFPLTLQSKKEYSCHITYSCIEEINIPPTISVLAEIERVKSFELPTLESSETPTVLLTVGEGSGEKTWQKIYYTFTSSIDQEATLILQGNYGTTCIHEVSVSQNGLSPFETAMQDLNHPLFPDII